MNLLEEAVSLAYVAVDDASDSLRQIVNSGVEIAHALVERLQTLVEIVVNHVGQRRYINIDIALLRIVFHNLIPQILVGIEASCVLLLRINVSGNTVNQYGYLAIVVEELVSRHSQLNEVVLVTLLTFNVNL